MAVLLEGFAKKMRHTVSTPIDYFLGLSDQECYLNPYLGEEVALEWMGEIACVACGASLKKTWNQGYCYRCSQTLAECDLCIVKPELCHFDLGTCRSVSFGNSHCNIPHYVYLAISSSPKVGLTRKGQEYIRWVDQGALASLRLAEVPRRKVAGELEVQLASFIADKTDWRKMLKNEVERLDLLALRSELLPKVAEEFRGYLLEGEEIQTFEYPVREYPKKVASHNFEKHSLFQGRLLGIKGQYWILDTGVVNLRKYTGYRFRFQSTSEIL
jgi:hypothetical protein